MQKKRLVCRICEERQTSKNGIRITTVFHEMYAANHILTQCIPGPSSTKQALFQEAKLACGEEMENEDVAEGWNASARDIPRYNRGSGIHRDLHDDRRGAEVRAASSIVSSGCGLAVNMTSHPLFKTSVSV